MKYILFIAIAGLLSQNSAGQIKTNFIDSVETAVVNIKEQLIKIKENYYVISADGMAGNIGVYIGKEYVLLVDDQWSVLSGRIKQILKTITDKPIKYIINTHYHFDHIDGNKAFGKENVTIIAQKNLRIRLAQDQVISGTEDFFGKVPQRAYPPEALPTLTFIDSLTLHEQPETIKLTWAKNAHTDGDAVVHFQNADIYHTGDIFITYGLPVIDETAGGNYYGMIKIIDHLISVSNSGTRFIPGHGPICTVTELKAYRKLLTSVKEQVSELMTKGKSLEDIINEVKTEEHVGGFKKAFISHIYRISTKESKNPVKIKS